MSDTNRKYIANVIREIESKLDKGEMYTHWSSAHRRAGVIEGLLMAEGVIDPNKTKVLDMKMISHPPLFGFWKVKDTQENYVRWAIRKGKEYLK